MAFCSKCGNEMQEGAKFCEKCGANFETGENSNASFDAVKEKFENFNNTADTTYEYDAADINNNKVMAILAYIGILVLVPLLAAKESKFARFHTNQGLVLWILSLACSIVMSIVTSVATIIGLWPLSLVTSLVSGAVGIITLVFMILGIVNAATGKAKELPLIGSIKIIK